MRRYSRESPYSSALTLRTCRIPSVNANAASVKSSEKTVNTIIDFVKIAAAFSQSCSPAYFAYFTTLPVEITVLIPPIRVKSGMTRLTAASAFAPTKLPTKIPSTIAADELAIVAIVQGSAILK